jgi:hypothetical protein
MPLHFGHLQNVVPEIFWKVLWPKGREKYNPGFTPRFVPLN